MWLSPRSAPHSDRVQQTTRIVARLSRTSGGNCLERSLVLYRYLARANADPELVIGMAKPDDYLGHVWVVVNEQPLLETSESLGLYTEVVRFGRGGAQER
jgi:hypothetical protein